MKNKIQKILAGFTAVFFIICIIEGMIFYSSKYNDIFVILTLNIQNAVKAFILSSNISIADAAGLLASESRLVRMMQYLYMLVVTLAPLCTAAAIVSALKWVYLRLMTSLRMRSKPPVTVIGSSAEAQNLAKGAAGKYQPFLYVGKAFSREKSIDLLKKNVQIVEGDYLTDDSLFEKKRLEHCAYIALMEKESLDNLSALGGVIAYLKEHEPKSTVICAVMCQDSAVSGMIEAYFRKTMMREDCRKLKEHLEIVIWNPYQLEAMEILHRQPVYAYQVSGYEENMEKNPQDFWNTHTVIAGFGRLGQQLLLQSLNMGVLHSKARMRFDVYDNCMEERLGHFMKNFAVDRRTKLEHGRLTIPFTGTMDGAAEIYFHQTDVFTVAFEESLHEIAEEMPVTYAAVCFNDSVLTMTAILSLEKVLTAEARKKVPLVAHLEAHKGICEFLHNDREEFLNVYISGERGKILTLDNIDHYVNDAYAMEFNYRYSQIDMENAEKWYRETETDSLKIRESWRKMPLVKQLSSRAMSAHSEVKLLRMAEYIYRTGNKKEQSGTFAAFWDSLKKEDTSCGEIFRPVREQMESLAEAKETAEFVRQLNQGENERETPGILRELAALEHRRWCQFMITAGYQYAAGKKDDDRKTNPCLLSWEDLSEKLPEYCQYDLAAYILLTEDVPVSRFCRTGQDREGRA